MPQRRWTWSARLSRLAILLFFLWLVGHVGVTAVWLPVFRAENAFARLQMGDQESRVVQLLGEPQYAKGLPDGSRSYEYYVYPNLLKQDFRVRSRWRVVVDSSDRVVAKYRLRGSGC